MLSTFSAAVRFPPNSLQIAYIFVDNKNIYQSPVSLYFLSIKEPLSNFLAVILWSTDYMPNIALSDTEFNPHNCLEVNSIIIPLYRWRNWGTQQWCDLLWFPELVVGRARSWTQVVWLQSLCLALSIILCCPYNTWGVPFLLSSTIRKIFQCPTSPLLLLEGKMVSVSSLVSQRNIHNLSLIEIHRKYCQT